MVPKEDINNLISIKSAAKDLKVSRITIWRWRKKGFLPTMFIDGRPYIRRSDLKDIIHPRRGRPKLEGKND
jgi:predicted site-specific integrase-resolvase